jgi:hypothetical protein
MDHDLEEAKNMKLLLSVFEELSNLKINLHNSDIFCYRIKELENQYMKLFGGNASEYSFRYFSISVHHRKL